MPEDELLRETLAVFGGQRLAAGIRERLMEVLALSDALRRDSDVLAPRRRARPLVGLRSTTSSAVALTRPGDLPRSPAARDHPLLPFRSQPAWRGRT
ncbi:hypothetical protein WDV85_04350 [Pseudokineococcus sp. 5B2Z-1]|uniref:hypothetical protein n=1 Tax=Pseudokineococcus sp. 5B2Z-1 TaxID=3132744 RepID=UPI0030A8FCB6